MSYSAPWPSLSLAAAIAIGTLACISARTIAAPDEPLNGFNIIAAPGHAFGSSSAKLALTNAKLLGAGIIVINYHRLNPLRDGVRSRVRPDLALGNIDNMPINSQITLGSAFLGPTADDYYVFIFRQFTACSLAERYRVLAQVL